MSTEVELTTVDYTKPELKSEDLVKQVDSTTDSSSSQYNSASSSSPNSAQTSPNGKTHKNEKNQSIHQFDSRLMGGFYEACVGKFQEIYPSWQENWQLKDYPLSMSDKHKVYEMFAKLSNQSKEPMALLQNFDYGDIFNFEKFLQSLKQDGINAMNKYKQYLSNKDMKKFEVDLVLVHAKYGILLVDIKETDHLDYKRRSKIRSQLNNARSCLQSLVKLIVDAKGLPHDTTIPITELVALPNVIERPTNNSNSQQLNNQNQKPSPISHLKQLNYMVKSDLEKPEAFATWWNENIVEKMQTQPELDKSLLNHFLGMISCIKHNSVMPVLHQQLDLTSPQDGILLNGNTQPVKQNETENESEKKDKEEKEKENYKLNVSAEFFHEKHEKVRSLSKVTILSKDSEKIRRTVCLQTLWLLLNDSSKKVSVICSEQNKAYYEEYFQRQRKLYSNLSNVRFYSDLQSFGVNNTLKKEGEMWFFDYDMNTLSKEVIERIKELHAFWIFTQDDQTCKKEFESLNVEYVDLDQVDTQQQQQDQPTDATDKKPWLSGLHLKLPLRLQCDLLIIGDIISPNQLKLMYTHFTSGVKMNQLNNNGHHYNNNGHHQVQHSQAAKKLKSIKFIRGGTIENIRKTLKMHDSIQAQVVLMHVGDEDVFKTRNSQATVERVKELTQLVKEYCPKSFVVLSTLMRRASKSENSVTNDVNKGIINFCKQTRDSSNFFYMLNNHFDPDYHTYEGRVLSNKGLRLYVENILFVVDYFLVKNNKQH